MCLDPTFELSCSHMSFYTYAFWPYEIVIISVGAIFISDSNTISKIVSEFDSRYVGPSVIRFSLSNHPSFIFRLYMSTPKREGAC